VVEVYNELEIGPRTALTVQATDAAITTRVKAAFVEQKVLTATAVKVVTENNVVYLMGLVTRREAPAYSAVASRVGGVRRVVTLFEYITDEEFSASARAEPTQTTVNRRALARAAGHH